MSTTNNYLLVLTGSVYYEFGYYQEYFPVMEKIDQVVSGTQSVYTLKWLKAKTSCRLVLFTNGRTMIKCNRIFSSRSRFHYNPRTRSHVRTQRIQNKKAIRSKLPGLLFTDGLPTDPMIMGWWSRDYTVGLGRRGGGERCPIQWYIGGGVGPIPWCSAPTTSREQTVRDMTENITFPQLSNVNDNHYLQQAMLG